MVKTRAGDDRIIRQILDSHAVYDLDAGTILQMEDAGFSKTLIACLIDTGANLVVDQAPPRPLGESPVAAPGPDFMWIPGEWHIQGGTWTWVGGGWILTPDANAVWVPTRWDYGANGWHRIPGRWQ